MEAQNLLSDSTNSPCLSISMKPRDQHTKLGGLLSRGWETGGEKARKMRDNEKINEIRGSGVGSGARLSISQEKPQAGRSEP